MNSQSGVGTTDWVFGDAIGNGVKALVEGATGTGLAAKVKEAYLFAARNWEPGDEIFIFGFSRGAYTARTVADLIGDIGLLDKEGQESFWSIYEHYYKANSDCNDAEKKAAEDALAPWRKRRDEQMEDFPFMIKVLGVFDTVGALGLPGFVPKEINYFGFNDLRLGRHVENAFHAMALNENRGAFPVTKWEFDDTHQPAPNQQVKQVWFAGSHSDIGGGWPESDLSMITLIWMASQIKDMLGINMDILMNDPHFRPSRPWGSFPPHNPQPEAASIFYAPRSNSIDLHPIAKGGAAELVHRSVFEQDLDDDEAIRLWPQHIRTLIENTSGCSGTVEELSEWERVLRDKVYKKPKVQTDDIIVSVLCSPAKDTVKARRRFGGIGTWLGWHGPAVRA
ncbi:hypothetical protein AX16_005854 [Volvariella volvacea WC 439]|nr:hypothetical protein AX16_005854 [Volvariella volvacea WC 439]